MRTTRTSRGVNIVRASRKPDRMPLVFDEHSITSIRETQVAMQCIDMRDESRFFSRASGNPMIPSIHYLFWFCSLGHPICQLSSHNCRLVLASSSLASLQLVHVPSTDRHISRVLVHAVRKALGGHGTVRVLLLVGIVVALLLLGGSSGLGVRGFAGAATAKKAADGMADRRTNGDASVCTFLSAT